MNAKDFIKYLLSIENYSFSLEEITRYTKRKGTPLKFELARLIGKKELVNLRKKYYLIITPRYSFSGTLPVQLYIDKLFNYLNRNYYLGFYTAAKIHGASHQQAQRDYVMIEKPKLNDIKKNNSDIRFLTTSNWPSKNIITKKADAGTYNISSPALTAIDLIHYQTKLGGLNRMLAIIEELTEEMNPEDIADLLTWYPHKSSLQRFGFLLEEIKADHNLSNQIIGYLQQSKYFPVLLSPKLKQKAGAVDNKWKVDVNIKLESDL